MEFRFDANQEFQVNAITAVTGLFDGQAKVEGQVRFQDGTVSLAAVANRLGLGDSALLENLRTVQESNGLKADEQLERITETIETVEGNATVAFANFSVEMETGTGKTYVYIRTILELHERYGMRKFIVVVPSVAVREGVLKTLDITRKHFSRLFGNPVYRFYAYDSSNLTQIRQFALSDSVEIMVMTIDSFNKATNVIKQSTDRLQGETPIHLVQAARPILVLDEPQNMESELRIKALANLNPLLALRYSATHRNPYNCVHRLTPFEAYRQGLVKRIEVASVLKDDDENEVFLRLDEVRTKKKTVSARIAVHALQKTGTVKEKVVTVRAGDSLEAKANRPEYAGFEVSEISPAGQYVRFANNVEVSVGQTRGADREEIFAAQIAYTIEEHFRRQKKLRGTGLKVLSLFFIDRVDNYAAEDGIIRRLFDEKFNEIKTRFPEWEKIAPANVQAAYFAVKRRKGGVTELVDSKTGKSSADEEAYDLIMKDKERLLNFDEPVAFIFSHSALREGWDSPNVFQICTLNQTASEIKKRQEIGRGMRLAVNQDGVRVRDEQMNILTVVANESYDLYVQRLQAELEEDYGKDGLPPQPANARKRGKARLRKQFTLEPEFKELWGRIRHKTRYSVTIDTERLLQDVMVALNGVTIRPPSIKAGKVLLQVADNENRLDVLNTTGGMKSVQELAPRTFPNIVDLMAHMLEHTSPPVRLTRRTLLEVFRRSARQAEAMKNPHQFATEAVRILKARLADELVKGIQYEKIDEWYEMARFEAEIGSWKEYLVPAEHSLYDNVVVDSDVERGFVQGLERRPDVRLYVKLPAWFVVDTPVGTYNADWAIVMDQKDEFGEPTGDEKLYLVRETKDKDWQTSLRPDEARKVLCGKAHFADALDVDYRVVSSASELP